MSRGPCRLALGAAVLIALAGSGAAASPFDRDGEIERAVEERIDGDPDLARLPLDVTVEEGRALVEGRVRGLAERRRAILEVGRVHGVIEVIDAIEVEVPRRSDESVRADLEALVRDRLKLGSSSLRFDVDEGTVLIEGSVEDARLRTRARNLAESGQTRRSCTLPSQIRCVASNCLLRRTRNQSDHQKATGCSNQ